MNPTLCLIGGCNGAGKTTLAGELLPRMGIRRFLNADAIAYGLSPLDPALSAIRAGRILVEETRTAVRDRISFGLESTLSGKSHLGTLRAAKEAGYLIVLDYIFLTSAAQAIERVATRVKQGGHQVPEADIRRRFERSRQHLLTHYIPIADAWVVWDNTAPPIRRVAASDTHNPNEILAMFDTSKIQEPSEAAVSEHVRLALEASRAATAKMLEHYRRMGIEVTPQMTLANPDEEPHLPPPNGCNPIT